MSQVFKDGSKTIAPQNICENDLQLEVLHVSRGWLNLEASLKVRVNVLTFEVSQVFKDCSKTVAPLNNR